MYMHYCKRCHHVHMLNGHKPLCPNCNGSIKELKISYMDYVSMDRDSRELFLNRLEDDVELQHLSTTYRMYKYSKRYKEQLKQSPPVPAPPAAIITYTISGESIMSNAVTAI